jgi:hypothetical protein
MIVSVLYAHHPVSQQLLFTENHSSREYLLVLFSILLGTTISTSLFASSQLTIIVQVVVGCSSALLLSVRASVCVVLLLLLLVCPGTNFNILMSADSSSTESVNKSHSRLAKRKRLYFGVVSGAVLLSLVHSSGLLRNPPVNNGSGLFVAAVRFVDVTAEDAETMRASIDTTSSIDTTAKTAEVLPDATIRLDTTTSTDVHTDPDLQLAGTSNSKVAGSARAEDVPVPTIELTGVEVESGAALPVNTTTSTDTAAMPKAAIPMQQAIQRDHDEQAQREKHDKPKDPVHPAVGADGSGGSTHSKLSQGLSSNATASSVPSAAHPQLAGHPPARIWGQAKNQFLWYIDHFSAANFIKNMRVAVESSIVSFIWGPPSNKTR